ncbi:unnamed protein product, partial [Ectocarpus fasciculatus]
LDGGVGVGGASDACCCRYSRDAANPAARGVPRGERVFCNIIIHATSRTAACNEPCMGARRRRRCETRKGVDGYWRG